MTTTAPSLAILLAGQEQSSLFSALNKKPAVSAKLTHKALSSKEVEQKQEIASRESIERKLDMFQRAVTRAKTLEEALSNPAVHKLLSNVYEINILGKNTDRFAKMVITDPADKNSDVARSRNTGMIKLASDLKKSGDGLGFLKDSKLQSTLKNHLVSIEFEEKARKINPAAGDAFYFERKSNGIKRGMDILANSVIRDVVFGALKISDSYKRKPIEAQVKLLDKKLKSLQGGKLDYSKFKDLKFVKGLSVDFLNQKQLSEPPTKPSLASILQSSGTTNSLFDFLT